MIFMLYFLWWKRSNPTASRSEGRDSDNGEAKDITEKDDVVKMVVCGRSDIDSEIANLITEMNRVGIRTTCSCQGHNGQPAYICIQLSEKVTYKYREDLNELVIIWKRLGSGD